eukprot:COSAG02_NODE_235_length_27784_cov_9.895828_20_plen_70_part_00
MSGFSLQEMSTQYMASILADLLPSLPALRTADRPRLQARPGSAPPMSQAMDGQGKTSMTAAGTWPFKVV